MVVSTVVLNLAVLLAGDQDNAESSVSLYIAGLHQKYGSMV